MQKKLVKLKKKSKLTNSYILRSLDTQMYLVRKRLLLQIMILAIRSLWYLNLLVSTTAYSRNIVGYCGGRIRSMRRGQRRLSGKAVYLEPPSVASSTTLSDDSTHKRLKSGAIGSTKEVNVAEFKDSADSIQLYPRCSDLSIIHNLGTLIPCRILSRPSKIIKSPYVADIVTLAGPHKGEIGLAHAPSLDCCMTVVPGSVVYCSENANKNSKTGYTIQVCLDRVVVGDSSIPEADRQQTFVGYHPSLAEVLTKDFLHSTYFRQSVVQELSKSSKYSHTKHLTLVNAMLCRGQVTVGDSRVDYMLSLPSNDESPDAATATLPSVLVEVKNVVCAEYGGVIENAQSKVRFGVYRGPVGQEEGIQEGPGYLCVSKRVGLSSIGESESFPRKCAIFPAGKKKAGTGVVSERAIKHIQNLITICTNDNAHRGVLVFIVNRSDCDAFRPCHEACMLFSQMLYRASLCENMDIMAIEVDFVATSLTGDDMTDRIKKQAMGSADHEEVNFVARITRELPVLVAKVVVDQAIDEDNLRKVLQTDE